MSPVLSTLLFVYVCACASILDAFYLEKVKDPRIFVPATLFWPVIVFVHFLAVARRFLFNSKGS